MELLMSSIDIEIVLLVTHQIHQDSHIFWTNVVRYISFGPNKEEKVKEKTGLIVFQYIFVISWVESMDICGKLSHEYVLNS